MKASVSGMILVSAREYQHFIQCFFVKPRHFTVEQETARFKMR